MVLEFANLVDPVYVFFRFSGDLKAPDRWLTAVAGVKQEYRGIPFAGLDHDNALPKMFIMPSTAAFSCLVNYWSFRRGSGRR